MRTGWFDEEDWGVCGENLQNPVTNDDERRKNEETEIAEQNTDLEALRALRSTST